MSAEDEIRQLRRDLAWRDIWNGIIILIMTSPFIYIFYVFLQVRWANLANP